jgi:ABC-type sugar transport system ATPase subunit
VADRVAVLIGGRLAQVGTPAEIYRQPGTVDVARLVGDPPMNLVSGSILEAGGEVRFRHPAFSLALSAAASARVKSAVLPDGIVLGLRAGDMGVVHGEASALRGSVWVWEPLGKHGVLSVRLGTDVVKVKVPKGARFEPGADVALALSGEPALFDGATGAAL